MTSLKGLDVEANRSATHRHGGGRGIVLVCTPGHWPQATANRIEYGPLGMSH